VEHLAQNQIKYINYILISGMNNSVVK